MTDLLMEAYTGDGDLFLMSYTDYDGDGIMEAFALMGVYDESSFQNEAELWYVCKDYAV